MIAKDVSEKWLIATSTCPYFEIEQHDVTAVLRPWKVISLKIITIFDLAGPVRYYQNLILICRPAVLILEKKFSSSSTWYWSPDKGIKMFTNTFVVLHSNDTQAQGWLSELFKVNICTADKHGLYPIWMELIIIDYSFGSSVAVVKLGANFF